MDWQRMKPTDLRPETVYILGAGFSYDAGMPLQSQILSNIRKFKLMDLPPILSGKFFAAQNEIFDFIGRIFQEVPNPCLEDIFTLIDQTIQRRSYCVGYDWQKLEVVHCALLDAIVMLFYTHESQVPLQAQNFYHAIAGHFIAERIKSGQKGHPFSIISLNWDCVLSKILFTGF